MSAYKNLCRSCVQDFASVSAFDRHRVGSHDYDFDFDLRPDGRRCLDEEEMLACGFVRNKWGRWSTSSYLTVITPDRERRDAA